MGCDFGSCAPHQAGLPSHRAGLPSQRAAPAMTVMAAPMAHRTTMTATSHQGIRWGAGEHEAGSPSSAGGLFVAGERARPFDGRGGEGMVHFLLGQGGKL